MLFRFVPPTVLQPRAVRGVSAPEAIDCDDDAAHEALQLMEQGVVVNVGGHGQRAGLATHWEIEQFCARWHESNPGGGDPLVDICLTDRFSYVMLRAS